MHRLRFPRRRMRGQKRPRPSHLPSPTSTQKLKADARGTPQLNRESRTLLGGASGTRAQILTVSNTVATRLV